ncbi:MAG: bifunctional diaminohydroxyphosphoribosylaminopyrimidine deaminase/5-amino-6-(5-phosphoribosylamino)uracil reductase RibD [Pseudoclavibacter sp.]
MRSTSDRGDRVADIDAAMVRAVELASRGPVHGPNPRVGCVLLAPADTSGSADASPAAAAPRRVIGEGYHRGAGMPHAEIDAMNDAQRRGEDLHGATAVVTLEPCAHTGRTPPCAEALATAGVAEVAFGMTDPNRLAAGGAELLRARSIPASLMESESAAALNEVWAIAVRRGTPFVTLKLATTLDGRVAAPNGSSQWITGQAAREHAHGVRRRVDAIAVGTGTLYADDPSLTARDAAGALDGHQPMRVVVGERRVPDEARVRGEGGELLHLPTRDVLRVLAELGGREVRHLLVEGGPTLATAFLRAGLVDELHAYAAPLLLGGGTSVVGDLGIQALDDAHRWQTERVERLGDDVLLVARRGPQPTAPDDENRDAIDES